MTSQADTSLAELSLSISRGSPVPLHHQLRHGLQGQIERGTLRPGQQIPHERQYAEHLGISLAPVRQALLDRLEPPPDPPLPADIEEEPNE